MYKIILILLANFILPNQWVNINSENASEPQINLLSSNSDNIQIEFELAGFYLKDVSVNNKNYNIVSMPQGAANLEYGMPDISHFSRSVIIPDDGLMNIEVLESEYIEYRNILIAPSKGNLSRTVNPNLVNYFFNDSYFSDEYYPEQIATLQEPYVLRDLRGQAVNIYPFQYNPIDKILRVYTNIVISISNNGIDQRNIIADRENFILDKEYRNIYEKQFINFNQDTRFDYLVDQGNMLIISDGNFIDTMQPLVDWKNMKGIPTEIINVSDIGVSSSAIESYVENYYNDNDLIFLLLVGDIAQIPSPTVSGSASDVSYGCISGNDFYPEVIVGRFSGSNPSQIETQVQRTIDYERYPQSGAEWYDNALGVASNQGPGFGGMMDDDFNEYLWDTVLSDFTYDSYEGIYDGSGGTDSQGISAINNGVSIINYTGHGNISSWGNGASLNTSQINQLTNNNKLPFVITVGCNVGEFNSTDECYAEAWQRATNGGEPAGGIAHFGSTISQSWEPPMHGQYGMNLILTESYEENLTRTIGGIVTNGCMYMNDAQGSSGINETKYWTLFGDPSINLRTAPPVNISASHEDVILIGQSEFVVDAGEDGALVALSRNGELLSSAYSIGGVAILSLDEETSNTPGDLDLVITGFNSFTYETTITVIAPEGAFLVVDDITINTFDELILYGEEVQFYINVSNIGADPVNGLNVSLNSENHYVNLSSENIENFDLSINPGNSGELGPFSFTVGNNVPNQHLIQLNCIFASEGNTWESELTFVADAPEIVVDSIEGTLVPGQSTTINVLLSNVGNAPINYPIVSAEGDMYTPVYSSGIGNAYYWDYLQSNNQELLQIDVSVDSSAPVGHVVEFDILISHLAGGYNNNITFFLPIGQFTEGFENDFSPSLEWVFTGDAEWQIDSAEQNSGSYSAKSGQIDHLQTSSISVLLDVVMEGSIEFYYKVASEYSPSGDNFYDGLEFYIDNELQNQFQPTSEGLSPWTYVSYSVQPGLHDFRWSYVKDQGGGTTDLEADCAWIDDITFPPSVINSDDSVVGDINNDGQVSILDVVQIINMVLGMDALDMVADVNSDGNVDVVDIVIIVNIILDN